MAQLRLFIRLARPHFLLGGLLLYALGASIAHYLGEPIDWNIYLLGQVWGTMLQLSVHFLNEYFDAPEDAHNPNRTLFSGGSGMLGPEGLARPVALWAGVACLAVVASFTVLLAVVARPTLSVWLLMLLIFLGSIFYSVPPVRLASSGYGELTTAFIIANLVPAFAFMLQYRDYHRLLAITTFPLSALAMAMLLAIELPDYGTDLRYNKRTLLIRIGWQAGMQIHNVMILLAYVLLAAGVVAGLPIRIALPAFLTLPVGLFGIYLINRIAAGDKPNWTLLGFVDFSLVGLVAYLLAITFWLH